jgi:hypothetical protein
MQAIKAVVQDGNVVVDDPLPLTGRYEAVLVLLDPDPWESLIKDARPRPELAKAGQIALEEYLSGKTTALIPDAMP